ncbi:MAG: sensor histidine kinase [Bdellovibrionota bacterium]
MQKDDQSLKNLIRKNVKSKDLIGSFILYMLEIFNLDAGFAIVVDTTSENDNNNENDNKNDNKNNSNFAFDISTNNIIANIITVNILDKVVENNVLVYKKIIEKNEPLFINKPLYGFKSSVLIPVKLDNFSNRKILFAFLKKDFLVSKEIYSNLRKEIFNFLKLLNYYSNYQIKNDAKKLSNIFLKNLNKISIGLSLGSIIDEYIKVLIKNMPSFISITSYKITNKIDKATLVSFHSKAKIVSINPYVNTDYLFKNFSNKCKIKSLENIFYNDKKKNVVFKKVELNDATSYVFIYELNKNYNYFDYEKLIKSSLSHINLLVCLYENKKQECDFGKQQSLSYLSSGLVHYVNNFLQGLSSRLELIKMLSKNDAKLLEQIDKILLSFDGAKSLSGKLSLISNNFSNNPYATLEDISFTDFIYDIFVKFSDEYADTYGDFLDLQINDLTNKYYTTCNKESLFLAIWGILVNAVEFSKDEFTDIRIKLNYFYKKNVDSCNFLTLFIDDLGRGMKKDVLSRAFEPFFSTKDIDIKTRISPNLYGLSLTISRAVITSIRGHIDIVSTEDIGTRVKIILPIKLNKIN